MPGDPGWHLPAAYTGPCISGGHRALHELAVAIAATGRRVEVRGQFDLDELRELSDAAGARPGVAEAPDRPGEGDVVFMPEGLEDPMNFGSVALSGARVILLLLAPPGLFGWPFARGWSRQPATDIDLGELGRPEHFRAMAALGFELWTQNPELARRIENAGVNCVLIGNGRPLPYPDPLPKRFDVVTLAHNRWAELSRSVVARLDGSVTSYEIPASPHREVLEKFGQSRVLVHPLRIEGTSRIGQEARAMGAVPVLLDSNPYRVGLDEGHGAVTVGSVDEMPGAIMALLGDPDRLNQLRERGMASARAQFDWPDYVQGIDQALSRAEQEDPARDARAVIGDALSLSARLTEARLAELSRDLAVAAEERNQAMARNHQLAETLAAVQSSRILRYTAGARRMYYRITRKRSGLTAPTTKPRY
jgi:hypothetical protein